MIVTAWSNGLMARRAPGKTGGVTDLSKARVAPTACLEESVIGGLVHRAEKVQVKRHRLNQRRGEDKRDEGVRGSGRSGPVRLVGQPRLQGNSRCHVE